MLFIRSLLISTFMRKHTQTNKRERSFSFYIDLFRSLFSYANQQNKTHKRIKHKKRKTRERQKKLKEKQWETGTWNRESNTNTHAYGFLFYTCAIWWCVARRYASAMDRSFSRSSSGSGLICNIVAHITNPTTAATTTQNDNKNRHRSVWLIR